MTPTPRTPSNYALDEPSDSTISSTEAAPQTDNIIVLAERRRPNRSSSTEGGPYGTPILAGFVSGMSEAEIRSQFPMLTDSPKHGLCGRASVFGYDTLLSFMFDSDGGLTALFMHIAFETHEQADMAFHEIVGAWEFELRSIEVNDYSDASAYIHSGRLSLYFARNLRSSIGGSHDPHLFIGASTVVPGSYTEDVPRTHSVTAEGEHA
jgi:hypothetical protein